jgi:polyisoprenoid-binding protein YceI
VRLRWLAALFLLLPLPVGAQTSTDDTPVIPAGDYAVEPAHTRVSFRVSYMGLSTVSGEFIGASGELTLNPFNPALSRLDITIPATNVATSSALMTTMLKSSIWLDSEEFPTVVFHSTKVLVTTPETADVEGLLTMHGETHPLVLKAHFNGTGIDVTNSSYTAAFDASGTLFLSDYGVSNFLSLVGNEVQLNISAAFEKK